MPKIYIYKMTSDDGAAPCVRDDLLSLAICKPIIRSVAKQGSIVLGFAGSDLYTDNCLVYAAKVGENLDGRKYFLEPRFSARPDCIYRWDGRRFERKSDAKFHSSPSHLAHDLGDADEYSRAHVLLSEGADNFRYFREKCPIRYKKEYPQLKSLIETLMQGHRVNYGPDLEAELRRFGQEVWSAASAYRETPAPDVPCDHKCGDDDFAEVEC